MRLRATAKIKISATSEIIRTLKIYCQGLQFCINIAWDRRIRNNAKLHPFVYKHLKSRGLQSQLAIACIKQACGMVKRAKSKPIVKRCSVRYNFPRSASLTNNVLSLATIKGRQKFPIRIPDCYAEYFKSWKVNESLLRIDKKGRCFFLFTFSKEVKTNNSIFPNKVVGLDFGINKLVVTSDRNFFRSSKVKQIKNKFFCLRRKLQAKGTRSARRLFKKLSGREKRFMAWYNHNISKQIVSKLKAGDVIVMENLKGIRSTSKGRKLNRWLHGWSFYQLQQFITYKAVRKGTTVIKVPARGTSKRCSKCGSMRTERHSGFFGCFDCGCHLDSDLNASYNIAQLYRRNLGKAAINQPCIPTDDTKAHFLNVNCG